MAGEWPALSYEAWSRDLRHAPRPHPGPRQAGRRSSHRPSRSCSTPRSGSPPVGWETPTMPAPERLRRDRRRRWTSAPTRRPWSTPAGARARIPLTAAPAGGRGDPRRPGGRRAAWPASRREQPERHRRCRGTSPLDEDSRARDLRPRPGRRPYFTAATQAALALGGVPGAVTAGRVDAGQRLVGQRSTSPCQPLQRRSRSDPPADDYIMRNSGDAEQISIGWWPGDQQPRRERPSSPWRIHSAARLRPRRTRTRRQRAGTPDLGEFVLDWEDIRSSEDPHALALDFAGAAYSHACEVCAWDPVLAASGLGDPPPIH